MKQKIEWYREVLELEPGSRVFFPLAKLLAADGQIADAVHCLRQGLLRHPDHVEARLLLVELLFLQDAGDELRREIDSLGVLFASYPGFWKAWSEQLSNTPALRDAALAMRFFAAALQGKNVSWGEIIEHGLQSLLGTPEGAASFSPAFTAPKTSAQEESALRNLAVATSNEPSPEPLNPEPADTEPDSADTPAEPPSENSVAEDVEPVAVDESPVLPEECAPAEEDEKQDDAGEGHEEEEETFSLRTRSMAEVLAEQGDIAGALDIYQELMEAAAPEERHSLEARADELSHRMHNGAPSESGKSDDKGKASGGESVRLVNLLEGLAQRLEARAR